MFGDDSDWITEWRETGIELGHYDGLAGMYLS